MKFCKISVLVIACGVFAAGCKRQAAPVREIMFQYDKYEINPLPPGIYDGVFGSGTTAWDNGGDSLVQTLV